MLFKYPTQSHQSDSFVCSLGNQLCRVEGQKLMCSCVAWPSRMRIEP